MQKPEARRVANMTAEQISRKREVDRSNQKNHRAKNKEYIRHLEAKVAELTYNLERAEARLREYEAQPQDPSPSAKASPPTSDQTSIKSQSYEQQDTQMNFLNDGLLAEFTSQTQPLSCDAWQTLSLDFGSGMAINLFDSPQALTFLDLGLQDINFMENANSLDSLGILSNSGMPITRPELTAPDWQLLPRHLPPKNKLDEILVTKTNHWRDRFLHSDRHIIELGEARFPSISSLLNQPSDDEKFPRPVSDVVAAQVLTSPVKSLVERIAFMYKLSYFIRWLVCQTEETYEQMPDFMRPTQLQRTVPHPAWMDIITHPDARDALIRDQNWNAYDSFRTKTGLSTTVSWPYPDSGAFMESPDGKSMRLNPLFEFHIRDQRNWKCGKEVVDAFPFMRPYCKT